MEAVFLFDVDGTLTAPRQEIDEEFADIFLTWANDPKKKVYLVTGSDIDKTKEQLFPSFLDQCDGIFACAGNAFYSRGGCLYENEWTPPLSLLEDLELYLEESEWRQATGNHIEVRQGMVNFTTVGRNASLDLRIAYNSWDEAQREREDIIFYITNLYPNIEASVGGEISVDIYPKGKNKSQVADKIWKMHGADSPIIFVGDRNMPGGNDWPLAQRLEEAANGHWFQVSCYEETRALIEYSELFI